MCHCPWIMKVRWKIKMKLWTQNAIHVNIWAVSWQNQRNAFATSMDPDLPGHPHSLFRIHAVRLQFLYLCYRVCKRTAWILIRLRGSAGWSGSMLVANPLCWFCHDTAHLYKKRVVQQHIHQTKYFHHRLGIHFERRELFLELWESC
jgi:hypothetical protein